MAYPRGQASVVAQAYAAGITITLPTGSIAPQAGDLIICLIGGASDQPVTGVVQSGASDYTIVNAPSTSAAGERLSYAWKIAAGGDADPYFIGLSSASSRWVGQAIVIRDVPATTPIEGVAWSYPAALPATWGSALTTTNADDLLLYVCHTGHYSNSVNGSLDGTASLGYVSGVSSGVTTCSMISGFKTQHTAGVCPTTKAYDLNKSGATCLVMAIKNSTGGVCYGNVTISALEIDSANQFPNYYGAMGVANSAALAWDAPSNATGGANINGLPVRATAATINPNIGRIGLYTYNNPTSINESVNLGVDTWCGASHPFTNAVDCRGKVFSLHWLFNLGQINIQIGNQGVAIVFTDNAGNWAAYSLRRKDAALLGVTDYRSFIALGSGANTPIDSSGTVDWQNIKRVAYIWHRVAGLTYDMIMYIRNAMLLTGATITDGYSGSPASFIDLVPAFNSWDQFNGVYKQASAQVMLLTDTQIGDGSTVTYFDMSAQSAEYPQEYSSKPAPTEQLIENGLAGTRTLSIYASGSDTLNLTAGVLAASVAQGLSVNAGSGTGVSFAGTSIVGMSITDNKALDWVGVSIKNAAMAVLKAAQLTNCNISGGTGTALISASNGFSDTGGTYTASATAIYGIRIAAAGTFDLDNTIFNGFTKDIDITAATGTVTINLAAGTSTPTYQTAGATVSIVSSPVYQVVVVSGFTAGSRIQIYDTTNAVELFNGTASAGNTVVSGTTAKWTDPSTAAGNRAIRVRVSYVTGATAKGFLELTGLTCGTTAGTESVTYPVTQVADTTYDDNAITGSTVTGVTFTDSSPDVVNIDVASNSITWPSIYAAWVYYAFTSTGIATDIDYIDGIDTANYILSNMKIKNTSSPSEPLVVSGGYGRDSTTGASVDLVDTTGGTLIFAPDHVVSYAVGSGVTSQDKTDIATAVLTAAASAPIASNIKQVNSLTVDGTGTEADPWGPV